jgi:subtilisin family serine protease
MERVLADGMQVLNMSIGSSFQWPQYPTAAASDRLVNKGVSVVASIGNSGANGAFPPARPAWARR